VLSSDELWEWLLSTGGKQAGKQARVLNELPCETLLNIPLRVIMNRRSAIEVSLIEISEDGTNEKRISRAFDLKKRVKFLELKTPALPGLEGVLSLLLFLRDSIETNLLSMRKLIIEYHQRHIRMECCLYAIMKLNSGTGCLLSKALKRSIKTLKIGPEIML